MISREIFTSRFCVLVNLCLPDVQQSRVAPGGGVGGVSRVAPGGGVGDVSRVAGGGGAGGVSRVASGGGVGV